MKIAYLITTYNRSKACKKLVDFLYGEGDIYLINDGSKGYSWVKNYKIFYQKNETNFGKEKYYITVTKLWQMISGEYDFFFMLPDDMLPVKNFQMRAIKKWMSIYDHRKICMNIYVGKSRLNKPCWTNQMPVEYENYRKTQWVDMAFLAEKEFFEVFKYSLPATRIKWVDKTLSSGVGSYISRILVNKGYNLYQTKKSLLIPQPEAFKSQMNGWRENQEINEVVI
jgi:hypothetical protein